MARFDYSGFEATALNLITQFGQSLTIYQENSTGYDPLTGSTTGGTITSTTCEGLTLPASKGTVQGFDDKFKEELVRGNARFFMLAASGMSFQPDAGNLLLFEDEVWDVSGVTPVNPAGVPLVYRVGVRRSGKPRSILGLPEIPPCEGLDIVDNEW